MKLKNLLASAALGASLIFPAIAVADETNDSQVKFTESNEEHAKLVGSVLNSGSFIYQERIENGFSDLKSISIESDAGLKNFEIDKEWDPNNCEIGILSPYKILNIRPVDDNQTIQVLTIAQYKFSNDNRKAILYYLDSGTQSTLEHPRLVITNDIPLYFPSEISKEVIIDGVQIPGFYLEDKQRNGCKQETIIDLKPLFSNQILTKDNLNDNTLEFIVLETISLGKYATLNEGEFGNFTNLNALNKNMSEYYLSNYKDDKQIKEIANSILNENKSLYQTTFDIFDFTRKSIEYENEELSLTPTEAMNEIKYKGKKPRGYGDCDDYSAIMVAILNAAGIPAYDSGGWITDFDKSGGHAWPEVCLPLKNGEPFWFISEPTWASNKENGYEKYFQQKDRSYICNLNVNLKFDTYLYNSIHEERFFNCNNGVLDLNSIVNKLKEFKEKENAKEVSSLEKIKSNSLTYPREFQKKKESKYFIKRNDSEDRFMYIILDSDNSLLVGYKTKDVWESPINNTGWDKTRLDSINSTYHGVLNNLNCTNKEIGSCIEYNIFRESEIDKIRATSVRFDSYLLKYHFDIIVNNLVENNLLTSEEATKFKEFYNACNGNNFYYFLEESR